MTDLVTLRDGKAVTINSREISELVASRHDDVKRSIDRLVTQGIIVQPPMADEPGFDALGRPRVTRVYIFTGEQGKRDSIIVVAQLSPEFTARLVDHWQELEARTAKPDPMAVLADPAAMRGLLLTYTEKVIELQQTVEEQAPKAAFHDQVVQSDHNHELGEAAKLIGTGRTRLARWMREHRWINRHGEPYQDKIEAGLLDLKYSRPWTHPEKGEMRSVTTMVTGKGLAKLQRLLPAATPDMFTGPVLA
ncbi:phage antirepressor KilAC domain-containing protein [Xanthomonas arboricola]|uniref:phage antirepressor KilAC domain-containing protein n=1 Tax=Xanthomonas arboricola TaxID=56448 RepID=UPI00063E955F|nr:phage antirepressor KilAC domain-containing protein [Xanthomonas arboricola]